MAAGSTYTPIEAKTLVSAAASVTFSSIPSTYTDLVLVFNGTNTATGPNDHYFIINGDTAANYSRTIMYGDGSSAISSRAPGETKLFLAGYFGTTNSTVIAQFQNYSNTTTNKTTLSRATSPTANTFAGVGLWRSTAAINSIQVAAFAGTYAIGSTFTLYGIAKA